MARNKRGVSASDEEKMVSINAGEGRSRRRAKRVVAVLDEHHCEQFKRAAASQGMSAKDLSAAILTEWVDENIRTRGGEFPEIPRRNKSRLNLAIIRQKFATTNESFLPFSEVVRQLEIKPATLRKCMKAGCPVKIFSNNSKRAQHFFIPAEVLAWIDGVASN